MLKRNTIKATKQNTPDLIKNALFIFFVHIVWGVNLLAAGFFFEMGLTRIKYIIGGLITISSVEQWIFKDSKDMRGGFAIIVHAIVLIIECRLLSVRYSNIWQIICIVELLIAFWLINLKNKDAIYEIINKISFFNIITHAINKHRKKGKF